MHYQRKHGHCELSTEHSSLPEGRTVRSLG
jgi:hypothetical protein